jgi:hypothetical protein
MLYRQLSLSIALIILLVPNLVVANEIEPEIDIEIGQILIQTNTNSLVFPNLKLPNNPAQIILNRGSIDRYMQQPDLFNRRRRMNISAPVRNSTTSTVKIRTSNNPQSSATVTNTKQHQSVRCSAEGTVVTQSSISTVNGRTVNSQTRTICN